MAVPKRKVSKGRRNRRRAHDFLTPKTMNTCPNCDAIVLSHHICQACGYYKGRSYKKSEVA